MAAIRNSSFAMPGTPCESVGFPMRVRLDEGRPYVIQMRALDARAHFSRAGRTGLAA
jgi:hypothetical protein